MPYRQTTFPVQPAGGLVQSLSPVQQGLESPGSAARLINFEPSINGGYRRINGYSKFSSTAVTGTGQIFGVAYFDGSVVAVRNGNIYQGTGGGWASIAAGRTHTTKHRYHIINLAGTRKLIGVDSSNYPYSWDGSTFTNINGSADVLGAKYVVQFKDHVFYAKGNLVTFSVPFDETDFTVASGSGSFNVKDVVTGMIVFRQRLFVFTETSISVLDGTSLTDFAMTSVADDIGAIRDDTVQEVGGDVAFLASDGARLLGATDRDGDFSNQLASRPVQKGLVGFKVEYDQYSSCVVRGKSQYRIFGYIAARTAEGTRGYLSTQFESQNPLSFAWSILEGFKVYAIDSQIHNGSEFIVFVSDGDYVYEMENGQTFDGTDISAQYWTPYLSLTDPLYRKTIYSVDVYFTPENSITGDLTLNFDFGKVTKVQPDSISFVQQGGGALYGEAIYGTDSYASENQDAVLEQLVIGAGNTVQARLDFTGERPFNIDAIFITYAQEERA